MLKQLLQLIKQASVEAVAQTKPMELIFGRVIQEETVDKPLLIQIEQKKPMTKAFFIANKYLNNLKLNDRLVLLMVQRGQMYYILEVLENGAD